MKMVEYRFFNNISQVLSLPDLMLSQTTASALVSFLWDNKDQTYLPTGLSPTFLFCLGFDYGIINAQDVILLLTWIGGMCLLRWYTFKVEAVHHRRY